MSGSPGQPPFDPFESPPVPQDPKAKLVLAAIQEIEAVGLPAVRVRGIAARAEMNVASVNYHFGSKARLVEVALGQTLGHTLEDTDALLARAADDPHGALFGLAAFLLEGAARYPNVTRAHALPALGEAGHDSGLGGLVDALRVRVGAVISAALPGAPEGVVAARATAFVSTLLFPAVFGGLVEAGQARETYVCQVVAAALRPA